MRFRKRPKVVEAIPVENILAGDKHPYWLTRSLKLGKVHISEHSVTVTTANQMKRMTNGFIAWDTKQEMVYAISNRTMAEDYEKLEEEVV